MRIDRLDLRAYGSMTNVTLDLAGTGRNMIVIYGDNEAGKTTTLRAIRHWLFGFEHSADEVDFHHKASALRIGGLLSNSNAQLASIRRKGRKDTLLDPDGKTPLPDNTLSAFLNAITQDQFTESFGLTHLSLREGGRQIADGQGDLGAALFAAASGVANLQKMRSGIAARKDELFKPKASTPKINEALREFNDAKKAWEAAMVKASEAERLGTEVNEKKVALEQVKAEVNRVAAEVASSKRLLEARKLVLRFADLEREHLALKNVVRLRPNFAAEHSEIMLGLSQARTLLESVDRQIGQHEEEIAAIVLDKAVLAVGEEIEAVNAKLDEIDEFRSLAEKREQSIRDKEGEAKQVLRKLGLALPVDLESYKESLRLSKRETNQLKKLAERHTELAASIKAADGFVTAQLAKLQKARARLETLRVETRTDSLQAAIEDASRIGDIQDRVAELQSKIESVSEKIQTGIARLGCKRGFEEIPTLGVPSREGIEYHRGRLDEAERKLAELRMERSHAVVELEELDLALANQQLRDVLPTGKDLATARTRRELGWQLIQRAWLSNDFDAAKVEDLTGAEASEPALAQHYVGSVEAADAIADQLAAEADRVRARADREALREKLRRKVDRLISQESLAQTELQSRSLEWRGAWVATAIEPRSPQEMSAWRDEWERVSEQIRTLTDTGRDLGKLDRIVADHSDRLKIALAGVGEDGDMLARRVDLPDLLALAKRVQKKFEQEMANRLKLEESVADAADALHAAEAERSLKQRELAEWGVAWSEATARLVEAGIASLLPDQLDEVLGEIGDYFAKLDFRKSQVLEQKNIVEKIERWRAATMAIAVQLGVADEFAASPNRAPLIAAWHARVQAARKASTRLQDRVEQVEKLRQQRPELELALAESQVRLQRLLAEARAEDADQLPDRIALADRLREIEKQIEDEYARPMRAIAAEAGCAPDAIAVLAAEAGGRDLAVEIAAAVSELERLDRDRDRASIELGDAESRRKELLGRRGGIDQREQMESALARLRDLVPDYAVLVLAEAVLDRALERYRERNKSDLFESASRLFGKLTCGRYEGLEIDLDEKDRQILVGIRRAGEAAERVTVTGMSDGTCDQLFLALRLAHLEKHVRDHGPFPIILDDILLTFDDERASAALDCLADLSERTQVLFFTHHRHLREMVAAERFRSRVGIVDLARS